MRQQWKALQRTVKAECMQRAWDELNSGFFALLPTCDHWQGGQQRRWCFRFNYLETRAYSLQISQRRRGDKRPAGLERWLAKDDANGGGGWALAAVATSLIVLIVRASTQIGEPLSGSWSARLGRSVLKLRG